MSLVTSRKKSEDGQVVPDSTSEKSGFSNGEDVLLQQRDGRYYLGTVIEVNLVSEMCRVKFGDNTEKWSSFKDLMKLTPKSDILCVICKKSQPKSDNEVIECDKCGRGYHQLCHQPHIRKQCNELEWFCNRCSPVVPSKIKEPASLKRIPLSVKKEPKSNTKKVLQKPKHEIEILNDDEDDDDDDDQLNTSDEELTCNLQELATMQDGPCYCGRRGSWIKKMLQCGRCKQWFHEQCIQCLTYPLYYGDRFYVFVCRLCNYGKEFVRRFEMNWVDIIHLTLYNLTFFYKRKYYDIDSIIVPYVNKNWECFQLPPKIFHVTPQKRKEIILTVLTNNRNRFKCGREIKKRTTIWGLREDIPPPAPTFKLPAQKQPISDANLKESWSGQERLKFLPPTLSSLASGKLSGKCHLDKGLRNNEGSSNGSSAGTTSPSMIGARTYTNGLSSSSESESLKTSRLSLPMHTDKVCIKSSQFYSRGFVKKSTPFPTESRQNMQESIRQRWKSESGTKSLNRRKRGRRTRGTVKEFTARKVRKLVKNARTRQTKKPLQELPPTPSPSSAAETPLPSGPGSQPLTTPGDTSGDDNSSRCTLDSFIPPPKDFEGKNHPFRSIAELFTLPNGLNVTSTLFQSTTTVINTSPITLPLSLTSVVQNPPPVRPAKRQLCEKDIRIDRNGDVKRRRLRRTRSSSMANGGTATASKTAAVTPVKTGDSKAAEAWNANGTVPARTLRSMYVNNTPSPSSSASGSQSNVPSASGVEYVLNGRRLRASPRIGNDKKLAATQPQPSPSKSSPVKQNSVKIPPLDDLKSSLNTYFGAANRIAAGEKFIIRAKRVTPQGKVQYLIQWEGPST